jgi:hypothetical protein
MVDITYSYHDKRTYDSMSNATFKRLDANILSPSRTDNGDFLEGMYDLQLPLSEFNRKGFYTVYIKPKEIAAEIADVSNLTAFPNVRGIVLDKERIQDDNVKQKAWTNGGIVGYRVIYLNGDGSRMDNLKIITSNNRCEPVIQAPNSSSDKTYTYRYEDSSNFTFVTLSPSSAPTFKANSMPYIGSVGQKILLVNTLFEPICIDIEMADNDMDTLSYMLEGSQVRDLDHGLITTFDDNGNIYHQDEVYSLKETETGDPIYEVKKKRENNIDFSQTINDK